MQKAKEETQLVKKAAEVEKRAAFQLGVGETQVRLAEELLEVRRDYCSVTWDKALSVASVLTNSVWRLPENVFYPQRSGRSLLMPHNLPSNLRLSQMPS